MLGDGGIEGEDVDVRCCCSLHSKLIQPISNVNNAASSLETFIFIQFPFVLFLEIFSFQNGMRQKHLADGIAKTDRITKILQNRENHLLDISEVTLRTTESAEDVQMLRSAAANDGRE